MDRYAYRKPSEDDLDFEKRSNSGFERRTFVHPKENLHEMGQFFSQQKQSRGRKSSFVYFLHDIISKLQSLMTSLQAQIILEAN